MVTDEDKALIGDCDEFQELAFFVRNLLLEDERLIVCDETQTGL